MASPTLHIFPNPVSGCYSCRRVINTGTSVRTGSTADLLPVSVPPVLKIKKRNEPISFGLFLALGGLATLFWSREMLNLALLMMGF